MENRCLARAFGRNRGVFVSHGTDLHSNRERSGIYYRQQARQQTPRFVDQHSSPVDAAVEPRQHASTIALESRQVVSTAHVSVPLDAFRRTHEFIGILHAVEGRPGQISVMKMAPRRRTPLVVLKDAGRAYDSARLTQRHQATGVRLHTGIRHRTSHVARIPSGASLVLFSNYIACQLCSRIEISTPVSLRPPTYRTMKRIQRVQCQRSLTLTNQIFAASTELHSLIDGIAAGLIDLAAEGLGEEALVGAFLELRNGPIVLSPLSEAAEGRPAVLARRLPRDPESCCRATC